MMPVSDRLLSEKEYKEYPFSADIYRAYGFTLEQIQQTKKRAFVFAYRIFPLTKSRAGKGNQKRRIV
jgi:hypothetical protein